MHSLLQHSSLKLDHFMLANGDNALACIILEYLAVCICMHANKLHSKGYDFCILQCKHSCVLLNSDFIL